MATSYLDQFYVIDASAPPPVGTAVSVVKYTLTDQNDDGDFDRFNNDSINGSDITSSYRGDTLTINVPGVGNVTYTGVTFYLANGQVVFTPNDGQVLEAGTFVSSTWVNGQGSLLASTLGPPCFATGTRIATPQGMRRVETLAPGDRVTTVDHGPQVLRWCGSRVVDGLGQHAPVRIRAGALGNDRDLVVSPEHRMLVTGWRAELHFGAPEVLVAARSLVNGCDILRAPRAQVTYWHLLFDRHEVILAEGAPSESLHPGGWLLQEDRRLRAAIAAVHPGLPTPGMAARLRAARPVVARANAAVLMAA